MFSKSTGRTFSSEACSNISHKIPRFCRTNKVLYHFQLITPLYIILSQLIPVHSERVFRTFVTYYCDCLLFSPPPPRSQNLAVKISLVSSADCFFSMCSQLSFTPWLLTWHNVKYINVCKLLSYWRQSVTHVSITLACAGCSSEFESKIFDHKPPKCVMS